MARPVTTLVVFFIALNLFAGVLSSTGVAATIGLDANVGADSDVNESVTNAQNVTTGTGQGDTLFGTYNVLGGQIKGFFRTIYPGLDMLYRAGVPGYITDSILAPLFSIAIFVDVVSFFRGWGL